jgi:hypothetical protein
MSHIFIASDGRQKTLEEVANYKKISKKSRLLHYLPTLIAQIIKGKEKFNA